MTFTNEAWDTDGFHSTTTNTGRITIPTGLGGYYLINAYCGTSTNDATEISINKNGASMSIGMDVGALDRRLTTNSNNEYYSAHWLINAAAGDYFQMYVTNFTSNKTVFRAAFQMTWIGA